MSTVMNITDHMRPYVTMRQARLKMETLRMGLDQALAWARAHISSQDGWLLAEAPEKVLWVPLAQAPEASGLGHCQNLLIFGPMSELRFHRSYDAPEGIARLIRQDDQGREGIERVSSCLLADSSGKLEYAEFFCRDEAIGILKLEFARCCGVRRRDGRI